MTTSINTNISAFFAQNNLRASSAEAQSSIARLSSGNSIIRASDDVAGLSIGTVLRTDVSTLNTALSNTNQASSLIQVADGAIQRLGEILQRQKALAVQGNADTLSDVERGYLNQEFTALTSEFERIAQETNFNGIALLNGNLSGVAQAANPLGADGVAPTDFTASNFGTTVTALTVAGLGADASDGADAVDAFAAGLATAVTTVDPGTDGSDGTITIVSGGVTFASAATDITGTPGAVTLTDATSGATLSVTFGPLTVSDAGSATTASGLIDGDIQGVTITNGYSADAVTGAASFQVGTSSTDTISISISSLATADIGTAALSVGTRADAISASDALDVAIDTVTGIRAEVGAIQSRFNFASATLETSIQNLDAARAGFLDADISSESTAFASQQVLIQASISVLAQANQLPQNLLKLIG